MSDEPDVPDGYAPRQSMRWEPECSACGARITADRLGLCPDPCECP